MVWAGGEDRMRSIERGRRAAATVVAACLICGAAGWPTRSAAEGALAVGLPADVAKEGFAFGYALEKSSAEEARAAALADCRGVARGRQARAGAVRPGRQLSQQMLCGRHGPQGRHTRG
ncbi:MAG TPA: hypothetical protein VIH62_03165, partial [Xanthobacteraceae bacterium]